MAFDPVSYLMGKKSGGGGGSSLIMPNISITMTDADTATATCNMSRAAIVSAIENGAICVARITDFPLPGMYKFTNDVLVDAGNDEGMIPMPASVSFITYELLGGGDVNWFTITVYDDVVECHIDHTISNSQ